VIPANVIRDKSHTLFNLGYSDPREQLHTLKILEKMATWKESGQAKRDSVNALIPKAWLLPTPLPPASEQRDVTGKYIQQFLSPKEIEITETDAVGIVQKTTSATWKAREVAEAFCHRAALAHQMVRASVTHWVVEKLTLDRFLVFMKYFSKLLSMMLNFWMSIMLSMENHWVHSMVCPSV
jgi:hypothetical protein